MSATLHSLRSKSVTIPIKIDDDPAFCYVTYRPHALVADDEKRAAKAGEGGLEIATLVELFLPVVESWDLKEFDTDAAPIPLTREVLVSKIPATLMMEIMNQISEDRKPDPKETS